MSQPFLLLADTAPFPRFPNYLLAGARSSDAGQGVGGAGRRTEKIFGVDRDSRKFGYISLARGNRGDRTRKFLEFWRDADDNDVFRFWWPLISLWTESHRQQLKELAAASLAESIVDRNIKNPQTHPGASSDRGSEEGVRIVVQFNTHLHLPF